MNKLMTAVLAVCPKVRGSASDLRQVDVRSRHPRSVPAAVVQEERGRSRGTRGGRSPREIPLVNRMHGTCLQTSSRATCCHAR
jgi:hypothetical protein